MTRSRRVRLNPDGTFPEREIPPPEVLNDNYRMMLAVLKAAKEAVKPPAWSTDEIVRLRKYHTDWQSQFNAITAGLTADQTGMREVLAPSFENELRSLRQALEPPPSIARLLSEMEAARGPSEQMLKGVTDGILSPAVLSGYRSLGSMLHDIEIQTAEIPRSSEIDSVASLLAPLEQYGKFIRESVESLSALDVEPTMRHALQGSILLASDVLGANVSITASMDASGVEGLATAQVAPSNLVLPFVLREELVAARQDLPSLDADDLAPHSRAHDVATRENRILKAIVDVNTANKLAGKQETFTPTTRLIIAIRNLVFLVVRDATTCGEFLDTLYFLLYEAAGKDHLRYHDSEGGPLTDDGCEIIWIIKHLRAYFRHDPDHGKPNDIRRKWRDLSDDLRSLGFDRMPTTEPEFRLLQERLVEEVERFADTLRRRF